MSIRTVATSKRFELHDESGYRFSIDASLDDEWGWDASVGFIARGLKTDADAVRALVPQVENFLRMLRHGLAVPPAPAEPCECFSCKLAEQERQTLPGTEDA